MAHTAAPAPPSSSRCLYVSNLPPSFTEYNLVSLFSPHGKISRLDLIFHKSGPLKGRTKGYAFIEYAKQEDAMSAKVKVDGKAVGGRRIAIGWANAQDPTSTAGPARTHHHHRTADADASKPTTLSLLKNSQRVKGGTNAKIAAMEAKLAALRGGSGGGGHNAKEDDDDGHSSTSPSTQSGLRKPPPTAGLPKKPPPPRP